LGWNSNQEYYNTIFATLELLRRFQWNFFRVENEQVNNIGAFRVVKEVPSVNPSRPSHIQIPAIHALKKRTHSFLSNVSLTQRLSFRSNEDHRSENEAEMIEVV
jgi:hypothetical protein